MQLEKVANPLRPGDAVNHQPGFEKTTTTPVHDFYKQFPSWCPDVFDEAALASGHSTHHSFHRYLEYHGHTTR